MKARDIFLYTIAIAALTAIVILSIFYRIDANPLNIWDEARVAVSALEMSQNHNYFIPTYQETPDMWSVKPPLMIIIQSFSMQLFGFNELGARMPTAIAAAATAGILLWFLAYFLKDFVAGFSAVLFLCTSSGYICHHVARTGDYDTLLIFFLTAYFVFALCYLLKESYRYYLLFNTFLLLAVFTKGIAGVFFISGLFIGFIFEARMRSKLFSVKILLPPLAVAVTFLSYYFIREHYNTGYIKTVLFEEMQGRLFDSKFDTNSKWYDFFESMVTKTFNPWWVFIPLSILAYNFAAVAERKIILVSATTLFIFWIPLTISINKNQWYNAPSFPILCIIAAIAFSKIFDSLTATINKSVHKILCLTVSISALSYLPLKNTFDNSAHLNERFGFAELVKSNRIPSGTKIVSEGYNSPIVFYQKALKLRGTIVETTSINNIKEGDTVIAISANEANEVKQHFQCEILYSCKETEMLLLKLKS